MAFVDIDGFIKENRLDTYEIKRGLNRVDK